MTAPVGADLETAERILQEHRIEKLPLVDENGRLFWLDYNQRYLSEFQMRLRIGWSFAYWLVP